MIAVTPDQQLAPDVDTAQSLVCEWRAGPLGPITCDQPATHRARLHLPYSKSVADGCASQTIFICDDHRKYILSGTVTLQVCLCGRPIRMLADIIEWIRPL